MSNASGVLTQQWPGYYTFVRDGQTLHVVAERLNGEAGWAVRESLHGRNLAFAPGVPAAAVRKYDTQDA